MDHCRGYRANVTTFCLSYQIKISPFLGISANFERDIFSSTRDPLYIWYVTKPTPQWLNSRETLLKNEQVAKHIVHVTDIQNPVAREQNLIVYILKLSDEKYIHRGRGGDRPLNNIINYIGAR